MKRFKHLVAAVAVCAALAPMTTTAQAQGFLDRLRDAAEGTELIRDAAENMEQVGRKFQDLTGATGGQTTREDEPEHASPLRTRREWRDIQARLNELGYYAGPVDGIPGRGTRRAIAAFERTNALDSDGNVDSAMLQALFSSDAGKMPQMASEPSGATGVTENTTRNDASRNLARPTLGDTLRNLQYADLLHKAQKGEAKAQNELGLRFERGWGVRQDDTEAIHWFHSSAERGDADGQFNLGRIYSRPHAERSARPGEAMYWLRRAVAQDHAKALGYLGNMHAYGIGVRKDLAKAADWYRRAAERGDAGGQSALSWMYKAARGGLPRDRVLAHMWINIAYANLSREIAKGDMASVERLITKTGAERAKALAQIRDRVRRYSGMSKLSAKGMLRQLEGIGGELASVEFSLSRTDIGRAKALAQKCLASNYKTCGQ